MSVIGSKGAMGAAKRIVSEMPAHTLYIECFGGTGAVGRLKKPAGLELFIERDPSTAASLAAAVKPRGGYVVCGDCMIGDSGELVWVRAPSAYTFGIPVGCETDPWK